MKHVGVYADEDPLINLETGKTYLDFSWVLHNGESVSEVFEPRFEGKDFPSLVLERPRQKETELARLKRAINCGLMKLNYNLALIQHGIILIENNLEQYWNRIFPGAEDWELTPAKPLYHWIKEVDPQLYGFKTMTEFGSPEVTKMNIEVLFQKLEIVSEDLKIKILNEIVPEEEEEEEVPANVPAGAALVEDDSSTESVPGITFQMIKDVSAVSAEHKKFAKKFLGIKETRKKPTPFRGRANARVLTKGIKKITEKLEHSIHGKALREKVEDWLETSFLTGRDEVRQLAASLVLAAAGREIVLHKQDEENYSDYDESEDEED
jgi:hypothetical protein